MADQSLLRIEDLWVRLEGRTVLESIHLDIGEREMVSIVGPNGGGKTTLLKAILGLVPSERGRILFMGRETGPARLKGQIGYLPQGGDMDMDLPLKARDVVAMARYSNQGWRERLKRSDQESIDRSLAGVGMEGAGEQFFSALSGGQKQRVLIARALALEPRLIILDEPSTGLDTVAQDSFYEVLRRLKEDHGLSILLVSHDIGSVSAYSDRIACLNRVIHFHGPPQECLTAESLTAVFGRNIQFLLHDRDCDTCRRGGKKS